MAQIYKLKTLITFSNLGKPEWGRLGNQLFQIASTLGIAYDNKQTAVFPGWDYAQYFSKSLPEGNITDCRKYKQKGHSYNQINLPVGNWDLLGFFQSERFFLNIEAEIRQQFTPSSDVLNYINQKYDYLLAKNTCSLHVRRGDYLKLSLAFPSQSLAYYRYAISQFPSGTQFLVFSDDINWCRDQFHGPMFTFIENEKDIIDLIVMSRCKHHIISNSSFSWWGAWLNPNPAKVVLCPAWWFGPAASILPKHHARDMYARGFKPLTLPDEQTWLKHIYYFISGPFYKLYYKTLEARYKLIQNKLVKSIVCKLKSAKT